MKMLFHVTLLESWQSSCFVFKQKLNKGSLITVLLIDNFTNKLLVEVDIILLAQYSYCFRLGSEYDPPIINQISIVACSVFLEVFVVLQI